MQSLNFNDQLAGLISGERLAADACHLGRRRLAGLAKVEFFMPDCESRADAAIDKLQNDLHGLPIFSQELLKTCDHALTLIGLNYKPTAADWSLAMSDEEINRPEFRTVFYNVESAQAANSTGWPGILRELRDDLRLWWTAWGDAKESLELLPKELVDDSNAPSLERWSIRLKRKLDGISESIYYSRAAIAGPCKADVDVKQLLSTLRQGGLPASLQTIDFADFERDLLAVRGTSDIKQGRQAHAAHSEKLFPNGPPVNVDLQDAIVYVDSHRDNGKSYNDLIQEKLKCSPEDAKKIEHQIRSLRSKGRTTLPAQIKRT